MNLVVRQAHLPTPPASASWSPSNARRPRAGDVYVAAAEHEGGAARRPRRGARSSAHAERGGRPHHPRPRARPAAASWAATRATAASAATSSPSTSGCCTSCSSPPARRAAPSRADGAGRDHAAARPPRATPRAACCRSSAGSRTPASTSRSSWRSTACPTPSRPEVEAEAERVPTAVGPEDLADRTDFRRWDTVTVDPETARDHDDAISLDRLPGGGWRLGRAHRRRRALRPPGIGPRPGGLPSRDVRLFPGPRRAHASARAVQQHLQPGRGPGPPHPDRGPGARRPAAGA